MALTSPEFLLLTAASVLLYYLLPGRFQWPLLLAAGLLFYCAGGGLTVLYVIAVALIENIAVCHFLPLDVGEAVRLVAHGRMQLIAWLINTTHC